jgi:hypothetical protein
MSSEIGQKQTETVDHGERDTYTEGSAELGKKKSPAVTKTCRFGLVEKAAR